MRLLEETISLVGDPDRKSYDTLAARWNTLTKPQASLGRLEEIACRYAAVRHDPQAKRGKRAVTVFVADHGIAEEGVSAYPKEVTVQMLRNIARGGAAISVLTRLLGHKLVVVDVGVEQDTSSENLPGVIYRRVGPGTRNFLHEPAMTREEAIKSVEVGIEIAQNAAMEGVTLIGLGEMGIGNTTTATAVLSALTGIEPGLLAGYGTGLDEEKRRHKVRVIEAALEKHQRRFNDPIGVLAAVGGFEIGAMAGVCLGAVAYRIVPVVDGFIATAAAVLAERLRPGVISQMFFAHRSAEGGHRLVLEHLNVYPILDLDMRLGEGTGAALALTIIDASLALVQEMATFAEAEVSEKIKL